MTVNIDCPHCGKLQLHRDLPLDACPTCGAPYPTKLRTTHAAALLLQQAPRPGVLTLGMYVSLILVGLAVVGAIAASLDFGTYTVNGQPVSGPEFLRWAGLSTALSTAALFGLLLWVGMGLRWNKPWTRRVMVGFWAAAYVSEIVGAFSDPEPWSALFVGVLGWTVLAGPAVLYLYWNKRVRAYYAALALARAAAQTVWG